MLRQICNTCVPTTQNGGKTFSASFTIADVIKKDSIDIISLDNPPFNRRKIYIPEGTFEEVWQELAKLKKKYPKV